jgi:hypothetical protein
LKLAEEIAAAVSSAAAQMDDDRWISGKHSRNKRLNALARFTLVNNAGVGGGTGSIDKLTTPNGAGYWTLI